MTHCALLGVSAERSPDYAGHRHKAQSVRTRADGKSHISANIFAYISMWEITKLGLCSSGPLQKLEALALAPRFYCLPA